jgi:hypothetical protein
MKFVAEDGKGFETYEEAKAYEESLKMSKNTEVCFNQLKDLISTGVIYSANIKEADGSVKATVVIHNPDGVEAGLREAVIMSAFGEPVVFDAKTFTYSPVYTVDTIKSKHTKLIEQLATDLTSGLDVYRVTNSYIMVNDVIIYSKELAKVADMLEKYLIGDDTFVNNPDKAFHDILSLLFGL